MSWRESSSPTEYPLEEGRPGSVGSSTRSQDWSYKEDHPEEQSVDCPPAGDGGCVLLPNASPGGVCRRNKRKQSEPRRLSTSSLAHVVKEEPTDTLDHQGDQGHLSNSGLTVDADDEYGFGGGAASAACARQRRGRHRQHHLGGVDELIPAAMLSLQGHTSRASNSSEDSLDLNPAMSSAALPLHPMVSMYGGGAESDDAKSDIEDPDGTGSHGTCADSPELMMVDVGEGDGDCTGNTGACTSPDSGGSSRGGPGPRAKKTSRSYKNLSRSRRIVANARERNRVHTISAAFEGLRRAVPSYSHNQKLSKLAILRIACSYILALASLADMDYSPDQHKLSFGECVEMCTRTLQSEGRSKRRKVPME